MKTLTTVLSLFLASQAMASSSSFVDDVLAQNIGEQTGVGQGGPNDCSMKIEEESYAGETAYRITLTLNSGELKGETTYQSGDFKTSGFSRKALVLRGSHGGGLGSVVGRSGPRTEVNVKLNVNAQKAVVGFEIQDGDDFASCDFNAE